MTEPGETASGAEPMSGALDTIDAVPTFAQPGDRGPDLPGGKFERPPFPPGCPVMPLGITSSSEGAQKCSYLDVRGQIVGLEAGNKHGKNNLVALFGEQSPWLEINFPQWSAPRYEGRGKERVQVKPPEIVGFDQADASRAMIEECVRKGRFDAAGKLRGRGAHDTPTRGLAVHYGDGVLVTQQRANGTIKGFDYAPCGLIDGYVYPSAAPSPRPWHDPATAKPAQKLLKLLQTWQWRRPLLDPRFLIGWIGAAMIGGALRWRPNVWITGAHGTGKSALNGERGALDEILGAGVLRTADASSAALRQLLAQSTIPVIFDEIEASGDNRKALDVVELARRATSGASQHRGGADHTAHEFNIRSCFQFSSINIPPLAPQDRTRLAILELLPFPADVAPLVLRDWGLAELGRQMQRRMIDGWERFEVMLARFEQALAARGHDRRACDQFGALLAAADVLLNEEPADDEEVREWAGRCAPELIAEVSAATPDHEACLQHLLTSQVQGRGGEDREALGSWIGEAVAATGGGGDALAEDKYSRRLQQRGLKIVNAHFLPPEFDQAGEVKNPGRWGAEAFLPSSPGFLAVAASHQGLDEIFHNTIWQGGVWRQALARVPDSLGSVKVKFIKHSLRAVLVPLAAVLDDGDLPPASRSDEIARWIDEQKAGAVPG